MAASKTGPRRPRPTEERFWEKVDQEGPISLEDGTRCWLWTGAENGVGYGRLWDGVHLIYPHRFAYELLVESIPEGLELDHRHTCLKCCVNPGHLRPATRKKNGENHAGPQANSTTGVRGVWWDKRTGKWAAEVWHYSEKYWVGRFVLLEDAEAAVVAKRNKLFTHNDVDRVAS
jgi:hypothetical protein